jgi:putative transport protein
MAASDAAIEAGSGADRMKFDLVTFLTDPFVLVFSAVFFGLLLGGIRIGRFDLGVSGSLFVGLGIGWYVYGHYALPYDGAAVVPQFAAAILRDGLVPKQLFTLSLILFVASVGLLAARDLGRVIRLYGFKFVILGMSVTLAGAVGIFALARLSGGQNPFAVAGVYTGALTSSPGLAAMLEMVAAQGQEAEALVGYGYAVAYAPGVLIVILAMQFFPLLFRIDLAEEKERYRREMAAAGAAGRDIPEVPLDIAAFAFVCLAGYYLGSLKIYLGPVIRYFSLGATGGILIAALLFGYIGRLGPLTFRMNPRILGEIRELSLALFLAIVGLRYGYDTVAAFTGGGAVLAVFSFLDGLFAVLVGFGLGRYVFGLNWIILSGALCGGMTSTPGLGAAIDAAKSDDVAAGYGATYPSALLGMVICSILLINLV